MIPSASRQHRALPLVEAVRGGADGPTDPTCRYCARVVLWVPTGYQRGEWIHYHSNRPACGPGAVG